jgi:c-di-GMP-binding flagellar brake protein YcgR
MENRRTGIRVSATLSVSFHEVESDFLGGSSGKNISEAGLCIPLTHILPIGSSLEIEIRSLDFGARVKAIARIAWVAPRDGKYPFEAGLEFLNLGPIDRDAIQYYIAHSAAKGETQEIRWIH